jgi:hypothetical protein
MYDVKPLPKMGAVVCSTNYRYEIVVSNAGLTMLD